MPARRYAHAIYGTHPVGEWRRAGVFPPMWLEREFERCAYGSTTSIYTPKPIQPFRHRPLPLGLGVRLGARADREIPF